MKNLKKILLAVVLVALIATSVITVALAEASYTGTVRDAKALLKLATSADKNASARVAPLTELSKYLVTVDPSEDGYDDVKEAYNQMTFKVMYEFYKEAESAATLKEKSAALAKVSSYAAAAPVIGDIEDVYLSYGYVCVADGCGRYREFTAEEYFNGLTDSHTCPGLCSVEEQKLVYATDSDKAYKYVDFAKSLNSEIMEVTNALVAQIYGMQESGAGYREVLKARTELDEYLDSVVTIIYKAPESALYTGDVAEAAALIKNVAETASFDTLKTKLAETYKYLTATPVIPTTDEYKVFIDKYNSLGNALVARLTEAVDGASSIEEKAEVLSGFYTYLSETQISENVVNGFNSLRSSLIEQYSNVGESANGLTVIEGKVPEAVYADDFDSFVEKIGAAEALGADSTDELGTAVSELYGMVSTGVYDPETAGYKKAVERYVALCVKYVNAEFVDAIAAEKDLTKKIEATQAFLDYINATPLCEQVTAAYAKVQSELLAQVKAFNATVSTVRIPAYVAPEKAPVTSSVFVLEDMLAELGENVAKYEAAEDKAAALSAMKKSLADLYSYVVANGLDTEADYYADFSAEFNTMRDAVVSAMVASVNGAAEADKLSALEAMKDYLTATPVSHSAVVAYNELAAALSAEAIEDVYILASGYMSVISNEASAYAAVIEAALKLVALNGGAFDITDPAYAVYVADFDAAIEKVSVALGDGLTAEMAVASASEYTAIVKKYQGYLSTVYFENSIDAVKAALAEMAASTSEDAAALESAFIYESKYEKVLDLVEAFKAAKTLDERVTVFGQIFGLLYGEYLTDEFISGESYALVAAEYQNVASKLEAELLALLNSSSVPEELVKNIESVYNYISDILFSNNLINKYNEACEAALSLDFGAAAEEFAKASDAFEYATPEGWSNYFARIKLALEMAGEEGEINDEFTVAYNILSGYVEDTAEGKEYGNRVVDFGAAEFASTLEMFDEVKANIVSANMRKVAGAKTPEDKAVVIAELAEFIKDYPFSAKLVETYAELCNSLANTYRNNLSAVFGDFEELVMLLEEHFDSCTVDTSLLDSVQKARYETVKSLIDALRITAVEGMIEEYNSINGVTALIYKNMLVDRINAYVGSKPLGSISDSEHVSAVLEFTFQEFIDAFTAELEGMDAAAKARHISAVGGYIQNAAFPYAVVSMYNSAFGTSYSASCSAAEKTASSMVELFDLLGEVDFTVSSYDILYSIEALVKYINEHNFNTVPVNEAANEKINAIKATLEKENAEQKASVDALAKPSEYSLPVIFNGHHEDGKHVGSMAGTGSDAGYTRTTQKVNGDTYAVYYTETGSSYINHTAIDATKGLVFELDLMSPDEDPSLQIYFYSTISGKKVQVRVFYIENGMFRYSLGTGDKDPTRFENYKEDEHAPIKLTPGQWTHLTVAFDFANDTMEMYIDYVSLGKKSIRNASGASVAFDAEIYNSFRMNSAGGTTQTVCFDDYKVYSGTSFRLTDKEMSQEEWFDTYVSSMLDETATAMARTSAYFSATQLRNSVDETLCAASVALFDGFDASAILAESNEYYLSNLESQASKIDLDKITTATSATVAKNVAAMEAYIEEYRQYMNQSSDSFMSIGELIIAAKAKNEWVANLALAVEHLGRFQRATTADSLTRHYNLFKGYYDICGLEDEAMMDVAMADPVCESFMEKVLADDGVLDVIGKNGTFADYCNEYIPTRRVAQDYYENSVIILDCMDFIKTIIDDEDSFESAEAYTEALIAAARENYDFVETYLSIIRLINRADEYDKTVEGISDTMILFATLDEEFDRILKEKQYGVIKERLDRYVVTNSYIEKAGICTFLENYIAENNVDLSGEGTQYLYALEIYKQEIEVYREDFEAVLAANTESFIGLVEKMKSYTSYADLKPLYDEAIANYYYSMNVDSDRAKAAVEAFATYQDMIFDWEANSAMFIGYANDAASARRQAQKFRALVRCANYADKVDVGIAGVAAALDKYNEALASYNESIAPARAEISEIGNVVCALRTESVPAPVLAIVKKYMDN